MEHESFPNIPRSRCAPHSIPLTPSRLTIRPRQPSAPDMIEDPGFTLATDHQVLPESRTLDSEIRRDPPPSENRNRALPTPIAGKLSLRLFDTRTDPGESTNLAGRPEHRARVNRMLGQLSAWAKRTSRQPNNIPDTKDPMIILDHCAQPHDVSAGEALAGSER